MHCHSRAGSQTCGAVKRLATTARGSRTYSMSVPAAARTLVPYGQAGPVRPAARPATGLLSASRVRPQPGYGPTRPGFMASSPATRRQDRWLSPVRQAAGRQHGLLVRPGLRPAQRRVPRSAAAGRISGSSLGQGPFHRPARSATRLPGWSPVDRPRNKAPAVDYGTDRVALLWWSVVVVVLLFLFRRVRGAPVGSTGSPDQLFAAGRPRPCISNQDQKGGPPPISLAKRCGVSQPTTTSCRRSKGAKIQGGTRDRRRPGSAASNGGRRPARGSCKQGQQLHRDGRAKARHATAERQVVACRPNGFQPGQQLHQGQWPEPGQLRGKRPFGQPFPANGRFHCPPSWTKNSTRHGLSATGRPDRTVRTDPGRARLLTGHRRWVTSVPRPPPPTDGTGRRHRDRGGSY